MSADSRSRNLRRISRALVVGGLCLAVGAPLLACKKEGATPTTNSRKKSPRAKWLDSPAQGKTEGGRITIPGLDVIFMKPNVLYVYKECGEASHKPDDTDKSWIPVIRCTSPFGSEGEDEFGASSDDGSETVTLTIYVTQKDTIVNERTVETFRSKYLNAGYKVDEITYVEDYLTKENRSGIYSKVHLIDGEGYPTREIQRFMFPKDDVLFIAHIDYPYGDDRSGIMGDWERILWNFEFVGEQSIATMTDAEVAAHNAKEEAAGGE